MLITSIVWFGFGCFCYVLWVSGYVGFGCFGGLDVFVVWALFADGC